MSLFSLIQTQNQKDLKNIKSKIELITFYAFAFFLLAEMAIAILSWEFTLFFIFGLFFGFIFGVLGFALALIASCET